MRRLVSQLGIILLALVVGGWGNALAAAFCPHMAASQPQAAAEVRDSCHAKIESASTHHSSSHHQAMHAAKTRQASDSHLQDAAAFGPIAGTCAHCVSQSGLPATPASARELTLQKRGAGKLAGHAMTPFAPPVAVSISQFAPTQHAPPAHAGRKHLFLSVFLI